MFKFDVNVVKVELKFNIFDLGWQYKADAMYACRMIVIKLKLTCEVCV